MQSAPRGSRRHIAVFGKRNAGKSSLINAIAGQDVALVSDVPGTTTDPVFKSMEWLPLGPIVMIDTAGIDDTGELGEMRIRKTKEIIDRTDLALLLIADLNDFELEKQWLKQFNNRSIPVIGVINKMNDRPVQAEALRTQLNIPFAEVCLKENINLGELKQEILKALPIENEGAPFLGDLVSRGDVVVLVMPQNMQAPKGRLILPQVQAIRDTLDRHACVFAVTEEELEQALSILTKKPELVITDSQVFKQVNAIVPEDVPLTSFSILMARTKGDLPALAEGAKAIDRLQPGDPVLIAEACSHHAMQGDIGREKLPAWLEQHVGGKLKITMNAGHVFPIDLCEYKLVIHCGGCMFNRKQMMSRISQSVEQGVPMTNYGIAIAHLHGILKRAMSPFAVLH